MEPLRAGRPSFAASMLQPKRLIAALVPKIATSVPTWRIPASVAMTTIITDELKAYSIQRAGFRPRASRRSYQARARKASVNWARWSAARTAFQRNRP